MRYPILLGMVLAVLASAGLACRKSAADLEFEKGFQPLVDDFNFIASRESPDKERRLLSTTTAPGRQLVFRTRISLFTKADLKTPRLAEYQATLRRELPERLNRTELFQKLNGMGVTLQYHYVGTDDTPLFSLRLKPSPEGGYAPA